MASIDEDIEAAETTVIRSNPWPRLANLPERLAEASFAPDAFRNELKEAHAELAERFAADESVETLVHARAELIDAILREVWRSQLPAGYERWTLAAVGGYGRGELHPHSDVDILILVPEAPDDSGRGVVERVVTFLWDINLEVGHSVRTVSECAEESAADVGVMTTLVEARLLAGNSQLLAAMRDAVSAERIWSIKNYFEAKVAEQQDRHLKANDTAYNLEPNVKTGPGGLRDIQTIAWVAKRHFGASSLDELLTHGFLSQSELRKLKQAQSFLWKVRFGLHVLTGRREDRLLFDHQIKLAQSFGYEDASYTLAVEQFMQRYYRTVMDVSLLNELLLQLFREAILTETTPTAPGQSHGSRFATTTWKRSTTRFSRAPRRRCSRSSWSCSRTRKSGVCVPRPFAPSPRISGSSTRNSARTRATTGCSSSCCARPPASRTNCAA